MRLDHLVYGVPDLAQGIKMVEARTGVRARFGGQHPGRGTHNALLSLGARRYLEIIAIDPEQADATGLLFPELRTLAQPRLIAWAVAVDSLTEVAKQATAADIEAVGPLEGSRTQADGSLLAWRTLRVISPSLMGLPFFIEWGSSAHPSETSPPGCRLASFHIEHTAPEALSNAFSKLNVEIPVIPSSQVRLTAQLSSPRGKIDL
jgi:glyoxalase-like protein